MKKLSGVSDKGMRRLAEAGFSSETLLTPEQRQEEILKLKEELNRLIEEDDAEYANSLRKKLKEEDPDSDADLFTDQAIMDWENGRLLDEQETKYPQM
jgi:hypothetical protein